MTAGFRCSAASDARVESLVGTASTVRAFLLVESPGPWGVDAVSGSRLPEDVKARLQELTRHHVRPLLIRDGGPRRPTTRVYAAFVHTDEPWVESAELADVRELLDLDLTGLGDGRSLGLTAHRDPMFLVCTHGKHDACCAERGRPLWKAMFLAAPEHTWQVSHIGGDRFAANVLVLPDGLYYGRLAPAHAPGLVGAHLAGHLDLDHLRGRCAYPFSVQAAEIFLRRHTGATALEPLPLIEHERHGGETRAVFTVDGTRWEVRVHADPGVKRQLTCRAGAPAFGPAHRLVGLRPDRRHPP